MVKLPFNWKLPLIGEKTKLNYIFYEDDVFAEQYLLKVNCELSEWIVKRIYDGFLRKHTRLDFKNGLLDGDSIDVPESFLSEKAGFFTWEEVLLKQFDKIFFKLVDKNKVVFVTKHISVMKITRKGTKFFAFFEIVGIKRALSVKK